MRLVDPDAVTAETLEVTLDMLYASMGPVRDSAPDPKPD
jgi:hypothetical protein